MKATKPLIHLIILYSGLILNFLTQGAMAQQKNEADSHIGGTVQLKQAGTSEYANARGVFETKLIKRSGSPQKSNPEDSADIPPPGVTQVFLDTKKNLTIKAWINLPAKKDMPAYPAIVFLHGGLSFGKGDWDMTRPFREAGFIVITPILRGENGQSGNFTFLYDEINDAIAAADYAKQQPFIDKSRIYLSGHSLGGILALLTSMCSDDFKKAVSFSGLPDMVLYHNYVIDPQELPFDTMNIKEFKMRSPLAYANSFRCPVRIYFGTEEPWILGSVSEHTAAIAKRSGLDVKAIAVQGGHMTAVDDEMKFAIQFFNQK
jgi:dienelactone hydrolase